MLQTPLSEVSSASVVKVLLWTEADGVGTTPSSTTTVLYFTELRHKSEQYTNRLIALPLPAELGYCSSSSV